MLLIYFAGRNFQYKIWRNTFSSRKFAWWNVQEEMVEIKLLELNFQYKIYRKKYSGYNLQEEIFSTKFAGRYFQYKICKRKDAGQNYSTWFSHFLLLLWKGEPIKIPNSILGKWLSLSKGEPFTQRRRIKFKQFSHTKMGELGKGRTN